MIHIQDPKFPCEVVHMDWVTALPPSGEKGYDARLVIVDRYSKTPIFLPCHKDDTSMDTALLLWNSNGFTNDWCTVIPALELEYKTSAHSSTGQAPAVLEKGWNPRLPADTLRKDLIYIHPTDYSLKIMLDKVKHHVKQSINDALDYAKKKWDKSHKVPDFKVGDLVLVSTLNFHNIKGPKRLKYSYVGPFVIVALHETNAVQVELSGELENKHSAFPVSLIKPYQPSDKELFPLRNPTPFTVPPVEQTEDKKIKKFIKERSLRGKNRREYLVRYRNPIHEDEWLAESEIPGADKLLRRLRYERRPKSCICL
ncbi:hypothetical protein O181_050746 [Austropuccinia psidii MF-1]|uniref:Tf2-1-like SH3-like domain-containing protein n=1 Tax=Austropuccinia psidii MF-1 TaxID=1389203 RepID=A0A9Q3HMN2_9BASI|nr:hypothetical protein [Austropuccinia psidii MF-1]